MMGTATIAGIGLTNVSYVEPSYPKLNAEHEIPGGVSVMQVLGRKRNTLKIYGILAPSSEVTNVATIGALSNTATISVTASVGGKDYGAGSSWCVESVSTQTLPGVATTQPWGHYTISLKETQ